MSLTSYLIEGLLPEEEKKRVVAVYGGGFKPPTSGHFAVAKQALEENPEIDEFIIYIGGKERNGITPDESILIWDIYKQYLPYKVEVKYTSVPPIKSIYNYAKEHPDEEVLFIIGAREGNEEDFKDIASRTTTLDKYPNLNLRTIVTQGGVSGTAARNASKISLEKFKPFVPSELSDEEVEQVYNIVADKITENITEGKQVGTLYHYTSTDGLKGILQSNSIRASKEYYLGNDINFVSFTRNKNFHKKGSAFDVKIDYRITLDGDKLSNKYKIKPFAYIPGWNYKDNWEYEWLDDEPESVVRDFLQGTGDYDEQEERISFKKPGGSITNIKDYILKVDKVSELTEGKKKKKDPEDGKAAPYGSGYKKLNENITKSQLDALETYADKLFAKLGIDIEFTRHFLDRANDKRNIKPISIPELMGMFKRLHKKHGKPLSKVDNDFDAVVKDFNSNINIPFAINVTPNDIDLVAKTVMRKKDFKTSTPVISLNENASYSQTIDLKKEIAKLTKHMIDKGMNIQPLPKLIFKNRDSENAKQFLGKTAYYDPNSMSIVLYTEGRHPKDIVRSFSHEMVHHTQNLENRLGNITTTNTTEDDHLDKLEQEANLKGTMTFRNWTDSLNENITKNPNYLYHWTSYSACKKILESNKLKSNKSNQFFGYDESRDLPDYENVVFFTVEDDRFADEGPSNQCILVVDKSKLSKDYKVISYGDPYEETVVYTNNSSIPILPYLKKVILNNTLQKSAIKKMVEFLESKGIPYEINYNLEKEVKDKQAKLPSLKKELINKLKLKYPNGFIGYLNTPLLPYQTPEYFKDNPTFSTPNITINKPGEYGRKNKFQIKFKIEPQNFEKYINWFMYDPNSIEDLINMDKYEGEELWLKGDIPIDSTTLQEANLRGTMTFRNWTDSLNEGNISEIGDGSSKSFEWEEDPNPSTTYDHEVSFTTDLGTKYEVYIDVYDVDNDPLFILKGINVNFDKGKIYKMLDIAFGVESQAANQITNKGELFSVMATIINITKHYLKKLKADGIIYNPSKKSEEGYADNQRNKLYKAYIQKTFPNAKIIEDNKEIIVLLDNKPLNEAVVGDKIECDNCDWSWDISSGGDDLYTCHKCWHDNTPIDENLDDSNLTNQLKNYIEDYSDIDVSLLKNLSKIKNKYPKQLDPKVGGNEFGYRGTTFDKDFIKKLKVKSKSNGVTEYEVPSGLKITSRGKKGFLSFSTDEEVAKGFGHYSGYVDYRKSDDKVGGYVKVSLDNPNFIIHPDYMGELSKDMEYSKESEKETLYVGDSFAPKSIFVVDKDLYKLKEDKKKDPFGLNAYARELGQLNEGRYDKSANQFSKIAFEAFKDIHDRGDKEGTFEFSVGPFDEDIYSEQFEFDFEGYVEITDNEYNVNGGANQGFDKKGDEITPLLNLNFKIPKNPDWQEISFDIKDVVRHELEHLTQGGLNLKGGAWDEDPKLRRPSKQMADDQLIRDLIDADMLPKSQYYKLEKEVDAMLQGLYFKAKKSKRPFKNVISDYLDIFVKQKTISLNDKEDILDLWRSRGKALSLPIFENQKQNMDYKIYSDMDGVLVDFEKGYEKLTGIDLKGEYRPDGEDFWKPIEQAGVGYWAGLEWMSDGKQLWNYLKPFNPVLLSAPSRSQSSRIGKHVWVKHKIPGTKLILRYAKQKQELATPESILIDDRQVNIDQWKAAGGIGILHTSTANTIQQLQKLGL